jgi:hypothetical protein
VPYCATTDLLTGDVPLSSRPNLDPVKFVADAADEIDSKIGFRYHTPIDTGDGSLPRPVSLLLKRLNAHLASGRLIMASTINSQGTETHAYGVYLVREASRTINMIAEGELLLEGVELASGVSVNNPAKVLISNLDAVSQVEAFYGAAASGSILPVGFPSPYRAAGG